MIDDILEFMKKWVKQKIKKRQEKKKYETLHKEIKIKYIQWRSREVNKCSNTDL